MGDFWKPTAEMFTSLIERPKMAEKLLIKPPFKYIYDILGQTTKVTGFGKGLYSGDELTQDYYESRERKIAYLQKMIDLVQLMGKEQIAAKPAKIVAGLEPQHTNKLLQIVYKLATSGTPSDPFVKKVLSGGKPESQPQQQPPPQPQPQAQPAKQVKQPNPTAAQKTEQKPKPDGSKEKEVPKPQPEPKDQKKGGKMSLKQQQPAPKMEVADPKKIVRPPSARKGGKGSEQKVVAPPSQPAIVDEDQPQVRQQPQRKQIKANQYSTRVQQAMKGDEQPAGKGNQEQGAGQDEGGNKIQMGKLRNNKRDNTQIAKASGELTQKELDMLKNMIQTICQNSTPLGKSIEFINDDIQSMNQELLGWRKQYNDSKAKMQNQLKLTEDALVPLYDKLAQIEQQTKDQKSKIQNMKSQIIKNQVTIKTLLHSVVTTKS